MKYIASVSNDQIILIDPTETLIAALPNLPIAHHQPGEFAIPITDRALIPSILTQLRDAGIAFAGASSGWPPSEIFADLRDRGLVSGTFDELVFRSKDKVELRQR